MSRLQVLVTALSLSLASPAPLYHPAGTAGGIAHGYTRAQLTDFQGDLMIYMPELGSPSYTGIRKGARGVDSGWIWTLWIPWYNASDRQRIYDKIKSYGFTHVAIQVSEQRAGDQGYRHLRPISAEDAANYGALMNTVHQELLDRGLIPICAGVAPGPTESGGANLAPGFDASACLVAMTDWDNSTWAAERIKKISDTFPNALLYYERPSDARRASGIDKSPNDPVDASWNIESGDQWIANMRRVCPRFLGVLYEVNNWPGGASVDDCAKEIQMAHDGFWRGVQEVRFETNTHQKFWQGGDPAMYAALDAQLQAKVSFLKGFMSGAAR